MRLVIKYYNEWGKFTSMQISVSSKGKISDLKDAIAKYTSIRSSQQEINVVTGDCQFQLIDDELYLSECQITDRSIIYVVNKSDEFSFEMPSNGGMLSGSERGSPIACKTNEAPNLSTNSIQLSESVMGSFAMDNPFIQKYTLSEYTELMGGIVDAMKRHDMEQVKGIYRRHKERLFALIDETKEDPSQFDMLNDVQHNNWSLTHLAVFLGNEKMVLWVMNEGGDLSLETKDGWDCILLAIWQGHYQVLTLLMGQSNLDINRGAARSTPLHLACELDDPHSVRILLNHPRINLFNVDKNNKRAIDLAGVKTRQLLLDEERRFLAPDQRLLESFRSSFKSFVQLSRGSTDSFMVNLPQRPPIIRGSVLKVNYFKIRHYQRYLILDPESGALARYKTEQDAPFSPNDLIPLESIDDIRLTKDLWFQDDRYFYIELSYFNKKIYIALQHKAAARQWYEALRNSIGYVKYVNGKVQAYLAQDTKKAQRSVVQVMMQQANQDVLIEDNGGLVDYKTHLKFQLAKHQEKYGRVAHLNSVSEQDEESSEIKQLSSQQAIDPIEQKHLKIGDFEIQELIGKGSFGHVYKAKCMLNGKLYALKQQEKDKMISSNHIQYVLSELSILKQLHHPFLVHLHFSFQTPYYLYLALDYCGRGDLSRYMTRGVILEELTAKFIIAEIILAIEYLHEKNIIYRDLKPENVILDDEGYIKLIDFGLSKEGIEADFIAKSFCGSPAYLSPELISGSGTTKATDIYSIGTILFEMLTGYPPFFTTSLKQLLNNIRYQKLVIPSTLSREAQNLLHKMLEKNPEARIGAKSINVLKKHIFFADINWDKLLMKKYIPPKLKPRQYLPPRTQLTQTQQMSQFIDDRDYENAQQRLNEIPGWNYGF